MMTNMMNNTPTNDDRRTISNPKYVYQGTQYLVLYRKATTQQAAKATNGVATASKRRQIKGGSHESGRFYRIAAAATDRHRQPAAMLFVVVSRRSSGIATEQQH